MLADEIAQYLSTKIRSGFFAYGTKLPTEHSLSDQFGVSRTVVREAISRIKSDGLVTSRQGSGVYVAHSATRRSFKLGEQLVDAADVLALFELRQPLELASARLAAARRTEDDLDRIRKAHAAMEATSDWSEEGVIADLAFHHEISMATGNAYYADFMAFLGGALQNTIRAARSGSGRPEIKQITIDEHARILNAIEQRDPESAAIAMSMHLQGAKERMSDKS
ncbi:FadR/GntR family transcriptional regulator [Kaistia algarum]|uniref:FadR/GntR family transcriptional regulator n=1 Tax=Kaistia algarum TaxID=2083279 RepID=UPI002256ADE7|nr:FadR/GntR family transcriptional regulator [Kaistia algarum]